jgi:hypothetical protein
MGDRRISGKFIPLLRSRNDNKYSIETAGKSLKSSFRNSFFSLIDPGRISTSESLLVDAGGATCFSESKAMVAIGHARCDNQKVGCW